MTLNQTNQATEASTLHLEKGNFLKLRNLTIGYTLPQAWTQKFYANKVRIYFSGENLLTITKFLAWTGNADWYGVCYNASVSIRY